MGYILFLTFGIPRWCVFHISWHTWTVSQFRKFSIIVRHPTPLGALAGVGVARVADIVHEITIFTNFYVGFLGIIRRHCFTAKSETMTVQALIVNETSLVDNKLILLTRKYLKCHNGIRNTLISNKKTTSDAIYFAASHFFVGFFLVDFFFVANIGITKAKQRNV